MTMKIAKSTLLKTAAALALTATFAACSGVATADPFRRDDRGPALPRADAGPAKASAAVFGADPGRGGGREDFGREDHDFDRAPARLGRDDRDPGSARPRDPFERNEPDARSRRDQRPFGGFERDDGRASAPRREFIAELLRDRRRFCDDNQRDRLKCHGLSP